MNNEEHATYALLLEDGCYYVGCSKTHNLKLRVSQHFSGDASSKWCRLHKPIRQIYYAEFDDYYEAFKDEHRKTVELMRKYGIRKVRGADALNTRHDCYQKHNLFWVPVELRDLARQGKLGKLDPSPLDDLDLS